MKPFRLVLFSAAVCFLTLNGCSKSKGVNDAQTHQSAKMLNISNILTDDEVDAIWDYPKKSNSIRARIDNDYLLPDTPGNRKRAANDNKKMREVDGTVSPFVKKLVNNGYWQMAKRNPEFDKAVWLLVQHSPDMALKKVTLEQISPLVERGLFSGVEYGLLFDRVAVATGHPQKFGSQMRCSNGNYEAFPLENPALVDSYRREYKFGETYASYLARFSKMKCW